MFRTNLYLAVSMLLLFISSCAVDVHVESLDLKLQSPSLQETAVSTTLTATGTEPATPDVSITPSPGSVVAPTITETLTTLHIVSIHPDMSVVTDVTGLAQQTYAIANEEYRNTSIDFLGVKNLEKIELALVRPVTDTNNPPPLTSTLASSQDIPWIVFQRTAKTDKAVCIPVDHTSWDEIRLNSVAGEMATSVPINWSWPISRLCTLPQGMSIKDWESKEWCAEGNCDGQDIWVDLAIINSSPSDPPTWKMYRFADAELNGSGGGDVEHIAYCRDIGCNGGGSICLYCWYQGCGC